MDGFMPFLGVGLAVADTNLKVGGFDSDNLHFGLSIGAGLDFALNPNWIVRGEYIFDTYEKRNYAGASGVNFDTHTLRLAVSYKF
jgi:outer membrane immunogenic protein